MHVLRSRQPIRLPLSASLLLSLACQMIWWASPAEAQGFFQQLFGLSPAPHVVTRPSARAPRAKINGWPQRASSAAPYNPYQPARTAPQGSGSYTTMCVRMCDGFYFPLSHRVPRSRFHRDADICRERCPGSEARLFYHSSASGSMRDAADLTGRAYARLPIAFRHRKQLVKGCGCKPEPWSVEALARHEGYAIVAGLHTPGRSLGGGPLTVLAGSYPDTSTPMASVSRSAEPTPDDQGPPPAAGTPSQPETAIHAANVADAQSSLDSAPSDPTTTEASDAKPAPPPSIMADSRPKRARGLKPPARASARQTTAQRKPPRAKTAALGLIGSGGSGGPKMTWPGDAPSRTR